MHVYEEKDICICVRRRMHTHIYKGMAHVRENIHILCEEEDACTQVYEEEDTYMRRRMHTRMYMRRRTRM